MGKAGFSLRESLTLQGVTTEEAMRQHLSLAHEMVKVRPDVRLHRYRVNPNHPNGAVPNMG